MVNVKNTLVLGVYVTAAILLVNFLLPMVGVEVVQLFGLTAPTGVTTTIGAKLVNFVNGLGIVNIDIMSMIYLYISAVAVLLVGSLLYGMINIPKRLSGASKLTATIVYGTLAFYVLFVGLVLQAWTVYVMMVVYAGIAAIVTGILQKYAPKVVRI